MLHPFEQHISTTIERLKLLRRSSPVLVALSGGADSVALLSALTALGYETIAAHCNFHLRGAESNRDMRHSEAIARQLGVNIHIRDFNVGARIKKTGESVEMACRELRYAWFDTLLDRDRAQAVAVAHHREDNVETFFLNLLRSTGIDGLTGMSWRRDYVVRPMLDVSRDEIESYLRDRHLDYVTDSSNDSDDFIRNRIRHHLIPTLEELFPGASSAILNTMSHLEMTRRLANDAINENLERIDGTESSLNVMQLIENCGVEKTGTILFERLKHLGFNARQVSDVVNATAKRRSGRHFFAGDYTAELDRGILTLHRRRKEVSPDIHKVNLNRDILTPVNIEVSLHNILDFNPSADQTTAYFDLSIFEGDPVFELRHPRIGDRMVPFGLNSGKLVSKLMKDARFSAAQKRDTWLLTRDNEIIWIVGLRPSALFSLTPDTRRYIKLVYRT